MNCGSSKVTRYYLCSSYVNNADCLDIEFREDVLALKITCTTYRNYSITCKKKRL